MQPHVYQSGRHVPSSGTGPGCALTTAVMAPEQCLPDMIYSHLARQPQQRYVHVAQVSSRHVSASRLGCSESGLLRVMCSPLQVTGVRSNQYSRGPSAPYMTSSMLMDAANQLGSNVKATMAAAQRLFEGDFDGALGNSGQSVPLCCNVCEALPCFHLDKQSICYMRKVLTMFNAAKQQSLSTGCGLSSDTWVQDCCQRRQQSRQPSWKV